MPILFSEVTVRNYAGTCRHGLPEGALQALKTRDVSARSYRLAVRDRAYLIHFLDGGLSDNLGIHPNARSGHHVGGAWNALKVLGRPETHRVVFIVVNAQTAISDEAIGRLGRLAVREQSQIGRFRCSEQL